MKNTTEQKQNRVLAEVKREYKHEINDPLILLQEKAFQGDAEAAMEALSGWPDQSARSACFPTVMEPT